MFIFAIIHFAFMDIQNWIKSYVIQVIPIITFCVYVLGFSYYIPYYYFFGINILSYVTLSEVLVAAFVPILLCLIIAALCKSMFTLYVNNLYPYLTHAYEEIVRLLPLNVYCLNCKLLKNKFGLKFRLKAFRIVTMAIFLGVIALIENIECEYVIKIKILIIVTIGVVAYILWALSWYSKIPSKKIKFVNYVITGSIVGIGMIVSLICLGISDAKSIKTENNRIFEIVMADGRRYNSKCYNFIGESQASFFIYRKSDQTTLILNREYVTNTVVYGE